MAFNHHHPHQQIMHNPHHPHDLMSLSSYNSTLTATSSTATDETMISSAGTFENLTYGNFSNNRRAGNGHYGSNGSLVSCSTNSTLTSTTAADTFIMPEDVIKYGKMRKLKVGFNVFYLKLQNFYTIFFAERQPQILCPSTKPPRGEKPHQSLLLRE